MSTLFVWFFWILVVIVVMRLHSYAIQFVCSTCAAIMCDEWWHKSIPSIFFSLFLHFPFIFFFRIENIHFVCVTEYTVLSNHSWCVFLRLNMECGFCRYAIGLPPNDCCWVYSLLLCIAFFFIFFILKFQICLPLVLSTK